MNIVTYPIVAAISICILALPSCCIRTSWGQRVCPENCKPIVKYSGHSLEVGKASIPVSGATVVVEGVKWDTKTLQQAATISQAMDLQRVTQCQHHNTALAVLTYEDYMKERNQMLASQQKLDQLAFIIAGNQAGALEKWIESYSSPAGKGAATKRRIYDPGKPVVDKAKFQP